MNKTIQYIYILVLQEERYIIYAKYKVEEHRSLSIIIVFFRSLSITRFAMVLWDCNFINTNILLLVNVVSPENELKYLNRSRSLCSIDIAT